MANAELDRDELTMSLYRHWAARVLAVDRALRAVGPGIHRRRRAVRNRPLLSGWRQIRRTRERPTEPGRARVEPVPSDAGDAMRAILTCAAIVGAAGWAAAEEPNPPPLDAAKLVGRWEAKGDPEKRRVVFEFAAQGKLVVRITRKGEETGKAEGTYKVDGRKLTLTLKLAGVENDRVVDVARLADGVLVGTGEQGRPLLLARVKDE